MKSVWKKLFFWSSIGSVALGTAVSMAQKNKKITPQTTWERIPPDCRKLTIWTEAFPLSRGGEISAASDRYVLLWTPFKVWNILDFGNPEKCDIREGAHVYHVTHWRYFIHGTEDTGVMMDRYYGTISVRSETDRMCLKNRISRGVVLAINKCYVGGTHNGVETGEVHLSSSPVSHFRYDYTIE